MVAIVNTWVFEQIWIGADDKLPRKVRAVFLADPSRLRHEMELSNWQLDPPVPADALDRKSTRLNSSHLVISYAVFCLNKKNNRNILAETLARLHGTFVKTNKAQLAPPSLAFELTSPPARSTTSPTPCRAEPVNASNCE